MFKLTKVFPSALELKLKPVLSPVQTGLLFAQLMLQLSVICLPGQIRPELVRLEDFVVAEAVVMLVEAVGMLTEAVWMLIEAFGMLAEAVGMLTEAVGMLTESVGMLTEAVGMLAEAIPVGALELIAVACVVAAAIVEG